MTKIVELYVQEDGNDTLTVIMGELQKIDDVTVTIRNSADAVQTFMLFEDEDPDYPRAREMLFIVDEDTIAEFNNDRGVNQKNEAIHELTCHSVEVLMGCLDLVPDDLQTLFDQFKESIIEKMSNDRNISLS